MNNKYGKCSCGGDLLPVFFEEKETKTEFGMLLHTGRKRKAVSHLVCEDCLKNKCVDDSFDGPWYR